MNLKFLKMTTCSLFIGLGIILPTFFHTIGLGSTFLPMHIPVLLCGLICGTFYGFACGLITPLLSSLTTGMPPIFPVATVMMFELSTYGAICGLMMTLFKKKITKPKFIPILSLMVAMVIGRVSYGIFGFIFYSMQGSFTFNIFISGAILSSLPGIILQIFLIPIVMETLDNYNILCKYSGNKPKKQLQIKY